MPPRSPTTRPPGEPNALARYLVATRRPLHSLTALAPLVVLHAVLSWIFRPPVTAAAASWVQGPLVHLGLSPFEAAVLLAAGFATAGLLLSWRERQRGEALRPGWLPLIWLEGAAWGLVLHLAWNHGLLAVAPDAVELGPGDALTLALGAGIYEELVFRVGLLGAAWLGLTAAARVVLGRERAAAPGVRAVVLAIAVGCCSLAFAAAHHLGPEPPTLAAVAFRVVAALYLTTLLALRGLGVTACAHVSYDVVVAFA